MTVQEQSVVDAAARLAAAVGHQPGCKFSGCTCGAATVLAERLGQYYSAVRRMREGVACRPKGWQ